MSDVVDRLNAALEGRYVIERELGEGGMATVYLADDLKHERKVAVKVLRPELAAVVGAERFLGEIKTTANLQHPHILPLFDSGEADSFLFYVMPYVQGETLREKLDRENQLGVEDALSLAKKIAGALDYAHGNGVVHRDIKPGNILLSKQGEPLVADFGIALAVAQAGGGRITETGLSLGTPHYMSPEQATGDRDVDPRSDVYALACVLYEMLAGEPPFSASTAQAILAKILTMDAPSITMVRRTVGPNVGGALAKALEKLPADRFTSVAAFAAALDDESFRYRPRTRQEGVQVETPESAPVAQRARGLPWPAQVAAAAGLAALAVFGWLRPAPEISPADVVRFPLVTPEDARLATGGGSADIAISPDGRLVAYMSADQEGPQLNLWALSELSGAPLRGAEGGFGPFFSPDGQWVGFQDRLAPRTIQRVSVLGGAPVTLVEAPSVPRGATWGRDGTIVFGTQDGGLFRVPEGGGEPEALTTLGEGEVRHLWPAIIDGRDAVVFTIVAPGGLALTGSTLAVLDLKSGEITRLDVQGVSPRYVSTGHLVYAASDGSLRAVPFDLATLTVTGTTVPLLEGLNVKPTGAADFDISNGGRLIHTSGGEAGGSATRSVLWVDRDGREEPLGITPQGYVYPRLSPDGRRLALDDRTNQTGLWIWDFGIETLTRLVLGEGNFMYQVWSPDGARLAYSEPSSEDIRWKASNNTGTPTVLLEGIRGAGSQQPEAYFFTPDGEHVVVRQQEIPETRDDLLMMPVSGGEPVWQLRGDFDERNAELSPDGRWMAYESFESGQFEIYVRPFPDVESDQVQVSNAGGIKPLWSRDGRELFYLQPGSTTQLISVSVEPTTAGGRFRPGGRQVVLDWPYLNDGNDGRTYDVSLDGQRFLAIEPTGGSEAVNTPDMTVVLNWFTELRERMGGN